jgi:two-component system, chemotaxis family, response regulator PixH
MVDFPISVKSSLDYAVIGCILSFRSQDGRQDLSKNDPVGSKVAGTLTVLVFADNHFNCEWLVEMLTYAGYRALETFNTAEALALAKEKNVSAVVVDHLKPWLSAFDFCRFMKNDPTTAAIPILMVNALNDQLVRKTAHLLGVKGIINRSMSEASFLSAVKNVITTPFPDQERTQEANFADHLYR